MDGHRHGGWRIVSSILARSQIGNLRAAVERLCAEVNRLRAENERLRAELEGRESRLAGRGCYDRYEWWLQQ
jgi:predicted RNase H-like nuclease (RuvC/YqgF family)